MSTSRENIRLIARAFLDLALTGQSICAFKAGVFTASSTGSLLPVILSVKIRQSWQQESTPELFRSLDLW